MRRDVRLREKERNGYNILQKRGVMEVVDEVMKVHQFAQFKREIPAPKHRHVTEAESWR